MHRIAAEGFSKGAEGYQNARPGYPSRAQAWLTERLGLRPGLRVLEVGAGTGKFTSYLLRTQAQVVALEPVAAMRERLRSNLPEATVAQGTAERLPFSDESFDAIVCAQSFHWFASHATLAEFKRVLKPGGMLGLIWNYRSFATPWVRLLDELTRPYEADAPRFTPELIDVWFPSPGFSSLVEEVVDHLHCGDPDIVIVGRTLSASFLANLDFEQRSIVRDQIRELVRSQIQLSSDGTVCFPYETYMFSLQTT